LRAGEYVGSASASLKRSVTKIKHEEQVSFFDIVDNKDSIIKRVVIMDAANRNLVPAYSFPILCPAAITGFAHIQDKWQKQIQMIFT
jgi:hypothetical protein